MFHDPSPPGGAGPGLRPRLRPGCPGCTAAAAHAAAAARRLSGVGRQQRQQQGQGAGGNGGGAGREVPGLAGNWRENHGRLAEIGEKMGIVAETL